MRSNYFQSGRKSRENFSPTDCTFAPRIGSPFPRRLSACVRFAVVQGASGAGNNEQQNVVHREAIEAGGKLFVVLNRELARARAVPWSLLVNEKPVRDGADARVRASFVAL